MPAPVVSAGTIGSALPRANVAGGKNAAAILDLTTGGLNSNADLEARIVAKAAFSVTLASAPTFAAYLCYASTTLAGAVSSPGATSITVASAGDIDPGQKIAIGGTGGALGETATVSAVSGTTLTLSSGLVNTYANGAAVNLIATIPSAGTPLQLGTSWAANTVQIRDLVLDTGRWCLEATNTDSATGGSTLAAVATVAFYTQGYA